MAIYHKGKKLSNQLHEGSGIYQIYHMGKAYLKEWLSSDTKATIRLVFGEEAVQVIKSTNAYLYTIASTDAQKAETLANYINEDPMLVCSLGLEPQGMNMPIRWLVGNGKSYFKTDIIPAPPFESEVKFMRKVVNADYISYASSRTGNHRAYMACVWETSFCLAYGADYKNVGTYTAYTPYVLHYISDENSTLYTLNGTNILNVSTPLSSNVKAKVLIGARQMDNTIDGILTSNDYLCYANLYEHGYFIPIKREGVMELVDVYSGNIATRVGTFTESYTLPDGTPWTPANPIQLTDK